MIYHVLANLVLCVHLAFILFVVAGGLLALRWRWAPFCHLPATLWGVYVEASRGVCPLTPLENALRLATGASGYTGGFVEHYLVPIVYPAGLPHWAQPLLAGLLVLVNLLVYWIVWRYGSRTQWGRLTNHTNPEIPMVTLAWATDLHFDAADEGAIETFCDALNDAHPNAVLLGGDYTMFDDLEETLRCIGSRVSADVYFVLGNHDYYGGCVEEVRQCASDLRSEDVHWLPAARCVELSPKIGLVGHGGWGDGRLGNLANSPVILTDYLAISDLADVIDRDDLLSGFRKKEALARKLAELGDDAADSLCPHLQEAMEQYPQVIVLTHVPPFREACWYADGISNDDYLPGFTCASMGQVILDCAQVHSECDITVLCGHTHGSGFVRLLPNLCAYTSQARYGQPKFRLVQVDNGELTVTKPPQ